MATEWLLPLLLILVFIGLAYLINKRKSLEITSSQEILSPVFYSYERFSYGKIWHFDNTQTENQNQIPWLFIHSIGSSLFCWRHQIDYFQSKQRILALDLLGFGKSDKPLDQAYDLDKTSERIFAFLDQKKISRCYLVGCSLGGALALWLKSQHPERFPKVAVISPAATSSVVPFLKIPHEKLSLLGQTIVSRALIKAALRGGLAAHDKITPDVIENYFFPYTNPAAVTCFLRTVSVIKDPRIFQSLARLTPDVLFLWGQKDRVIPRTALDKMLKEVPHHSFYIHNLGGHHLMEDEPDWINEKLNMFFDHRVQSPELSECLDS